jgi:hypothetical protein
MIFWDDICLRLLSIPSIILSYALLIIYELLNMFMEMWTSYVFRWFQMSWDFMYIEKNMESMKYLKLHKCVKAWAQMM